MGDLGVDTAVEEIGDGRYRAALSRDWEIWGPNGGYVAAIALRAGAAYSDLPRPASFSCHYLAAGEFAPAEAHVRTLRRTKRAESLAITLTQGDRVPPGAGQPRGHGLLRPDGALFLDRSFRRRPLTAEPEPGRGKRPRLDRWACALRSRGTAFRGKRFIRPSTGVPWRVRYRRTEIRQYRSATHRP